jgi:uncharacterized protein
MELVAREPFSVPLGELRRAGGSCRVVRKATLGEALVADVDSRVAAGTEVVVEVLLEAFDGGVAVSGTASAPWEGECRRCLAPLGGPLVARVKEMFRRGGGPDEGTYALGEEGLDLREMVCDCLFGELPLLPLCREGCLGICPSCGADLNTSQCACGEPVPDPRWAALDALRDS